MLLCSKKRSHLNVWSASRLIFEKKYSFIKKNPLLIIRAFGFKGWDVKLTFWKLKTMLYKSKWCFLLFNYTFVQWSGWQPVSPPHLILALLGDHLALIGYLMKCHRSNQIGCVQNKSLISYVLSFHHYTFTSFRKLAIFSCLLIFLFVFN